MGTESQNTDKSSESLILDLETLTKTYQNLLIEYQQAVVNYIDYIKAGQNDLSNNTQTFVTVKGSNYWGTSGISQNNSSTLNKCIDSCKKTKGCTGATYNVTDYSRPLCFLRSGSSSITSGKANDYAIINKGQHLLSIVKSINEKLTKINAEILAKTNVGQPLYDANLEESVSQNKLLINKYKILALDREKITEMMNEYQTLDEKQFQGNIKITQNYYSFILLLALSILIVYILFTFSEPSTRSLELQPGGDLNKNAYYIIFGIVIITIIIYFYTKHFSL